MKQSYHVTRGLDVLVGQRRIAVLTTRHSLTRLLTGFIAAEPTAGGTYGNIRYKKKNRK